MAALELVKILYEGGTRLFPTLSLTYLSSSYLFTGRVRAKKSEREIRIVFHVLNLLVLYGKIK